jgi:hypothetical protein
MVRDPIVEEVRRTRETIAAECGYDVHRLLLRQAHALKRWKGKVADTEELLKERDSARLAPS